ESNYSDPLDLHEVQHLFDPSSGNQELIVNETSPIIIEYGTTWWSRCWNEPVPTVGLPSILRSIEFRSSSQFLLRFTFLVSLSLRPIVTYYRSVAVAYRMSRGVKESARVPSK
ncbi:hypothetical protein PFISCL1PPCAC_13626, partial [Pristionchus fissidentatus]